MKNCIDNTNKCYCNELRECSNCNNISNIKNDKCILSSKDFCTCKHCGKAVRADGYCIKSQI